MENPVNKLLQDFYQLKREKNPAFSMRSFARSLQVDQAYLIRIIKGSRSASPQIAYKISQHLHLTHEETLKLIVCTFK